MKKTILAIALTTMAGMASAQVTVSGKIGQYLDRSEQGSVTSTKSVTEPTSNFAIAAREKLGDGWRARAVIETSLVGNTFGGNDTKLGDRQATVGLASKSGSLDIGRNVHSHFLAIADNDVFNTLYGSVAGEVHNLRGLRFSDGMFLTVNPHPNLTLAVERSQPGSAMATNVFAGAAKVGALTATAARFEQGRETSNVFGLKGKLGNTNLTYAYSEDQGLVSSKGQLLGASQRFGSVTAKASWGKTNHDVKAWALGADYHLGKRTDLSLSYKAVDRVGTAADVNAVIAGLTLKF